MAENQEVAEIGEGTFWLPQDILFNISLLETRSFQTQFKLFGKYDYSEVKVDDICFKDYISVSTVKSQVFIPHTAGRWQIKKFRKAQCPLVERLVGSLMFHGRNTGKKNMAVRIVKHAFQIIALMTGKNPIQVFIEAVQNGGARESSTRIGTGGVVRRQAVDVSPLKRANLAVYWMAVGARKAAFKNMKTIAECLADEIMNAAKVNQKTNIKT